MAKLAIDTQLALVGVITLVAAVAFDRGILVVVGQVAFLAGHGGVQANQGKTRDVMLELDAFAPAFLVMALVAFLALFALVHIVDFMAGITIGLELCLIYMGFVAGGAIDLHVFAAQFEVGLVVVKLLLGPGVFGMAGLAFLAEVTLVLVFVAVAGDAAGFDLFPERVVLVAALTAEFGVARA